MSLVSSYVGGSVSFSHPTRSLSSSFSLPLSQVSQDTSVSDTSVSPGQVSCHTNTCRCDIKISQETYLYTSILPSFTLVYSQTHSLEARLWVSEVSANSPLSKRERCNACLFESYFSKQHTEVPMAANVGPKSTIIDYYLHRAVVSFCIQTKTAASSSEVSHVQFSALAGQVTQQYK